MLSTGLLGQCREIRCRWPVSHRLAHVLPVDRPVLPDDEGGWHGDLAPLHCHTIGRDHGQLRIRQQRDWDLLLFQELSRILLFVGADGDDADPPLLQVARDFRQLSELLAAEWSPVAAIKDDDRRTVRQQLSERV